METDLQNRTKKFAPEAIKLYQKLPKSSDTQVLGKQLIRSGTSVGANTRSAFRGRSKKEFPAKLGIVMEKADESIFWLKLLKDTQELDSHKPDELIEESDALVSIFVSTIKKNNN